MKILMALMMTLAMTSAFGDCKLNETCSSEAECKVIDPGYALEGGKCVNPASKQTDTKCDQMVNSRASVDKSESSAPANGSEATKSTTK